MLVAQNSLGPVCPVPLTVRGRVVADGRTDRRRGRPHELRGLRRGLAQAAGRHEAAALARPRRRRATAGAPATDRDHPIRGLISFLKLIDAL